MIPATYKNQSGFALFVGKYQTRQDPRIALMSGRHAADAVQDAIAMGHETTAALYIAGFINDISRSYTSHEAVKLVRAHGVPLDGPGILLGLERGSEPTPTLLAIGITCQATPKGSLVHLIAPWYDPKLRPVNAANPLPRELEGVKGIIEWTNYRLLSLSQKETDARPLPAMGHERAFEKTRR